jgi:hypothetical protein
MFANTAIAALACLEAPSQPDPLCTKIATNAVVDQDAPVEASCNHTVVRIFRITEVLALLKVESGLTRKKLRGVLHAR